jgi:hypothetical protein
MSQPPPQQPNNQKGSMIDIDKLGADKHYDVDIRIQSTKGLSEHITTLIPLIVAGAIALIVTVSSLQVLSNPKALPDDKKTAQSLLTLVVGLTVGYAFGKAQATQS